MSQPTARIKKLREHALNKEKKGARSPEDNLYWHQGWLQYNQDSSNLVRRAHANAFMLKKVTPVIADHELIVGKPCYRELSETEQQQLNDLQQKMQASPKLGGQASHMAIDYERLLTMGVSGIKQQIESLRTQLQLQHPEDMQKDEFYKACLITLDGLLEYADNYGKLAEKMADNCSDKKRKNELLDIAEICKKVPRYPAESFKEAVQSIHFVTFCLKGLYQLGRPDRYLIDFYRRDIERGLLTQKEAQEIIDCLCFLFNEYIPDGLAVGLMVGGRNALGKDITNELTYLFIESIAHTKMIYPGIGLCYTDDTPKDLLLRCCELLREGYSHPAIFNDEVITRGLINYGLSPGEACQYIHSTCVEITPIASSGVWVASPYINLLQPLLDMIGVSSEENLNDNNKGEEFSTFTSLWDNYQQLLAKKIEREIIKQNKLQMERYYHGGDPLVSCFVNDCLQKGKDIDQGGARYNWIMPSFVGMSNLVDSLMSIKKLIYGDEKMNLEELAKVLKNDFNGREAFRQEILNRLPKYGNDIDEIDEMVKEITEWIAGETSKYKTYRGDRFVPSLFCWIQHERLGAQTPATPDGRKAGFPLGDGSGPAQGREKKGPTASILSSTKWDHEAFIGGIAVNMKFTRSLFEGESLTQMLNLIKTFMKRGGFEIQINVVDKETLLAAQKHPEQYQDLVVRVGGYSDYFVHLSPAMQEEVIARTEHQL